MPRGEFADWVKVSRNIPDPYLKDKQYDVKVDITQFQNAADWKTVLKFAGVKEMNPIIAEYKGVEVFMWFGKDIIISSICNPTTGDCLGQQHEGEIGFADFIYLSGKRNKVNRVFGKIRRIANYVKGAYIIDRYGRSHYEGYEFEY